MLRLWGTPPLNRTDALSEAPFLAMPSIPNSPRRITITIPFSTFAYLSKRSAEEGRSMSNLAAYLLERASTVEAPITEDKP